MSENLRELLAELVLDAMASGAACFIEKAAAGEIDPSGPMSTAFGDYPREWVEIRGDLVRPIEDLVTARDEQVRAAALVEAARFVEGYGGFYKIPRQRALVAQHIRGLRAASSQGSKS